MSVLLLEAGPDYPDPANLPDEVKFGHTRFAEAPDSQHNWALRGTITEEQGAIHVAQGKVIGGGSSINGQAMQRGFPEDFNSWAALGNDEWSYDKILPYFRKSERDLDIQDNYCHGSDGPMPVRRRQTGPWPAIQQAFHAACVQAGFGTTNDKNGLHPAGLGVSPSNNLDGVRMSTAMTHLNPVRHHLNLTVRGGVFVRKIVIEDGKAVGVEAESGGQGVPGRGRPGGAERRRDPIAPSADALGHRPRGPTAAIRDTNGSSSPRRRPEPEEPPQRPDDLQGQGRHLARCAYRCRALFACTTPPKDRAPSTIWCCGPVRSSTNGRSASPGVRTKYLSGDVPPEQVARISCTLGLPDGSGYVRLASADPSSSRPSTIVISSIQTTFDGCGKACDWR